MKSWSELSPAERKAAAKTGRSGWGSFGSVDTHALYVKPVEKVKGRCGCCGEPATHVGMANGVALMSGCEMQARRWAKQMACV